MAKRKTVDIEFLKDKINQMLQDSTCSSDMREGMIVTLEIALMETGNYKGFRYLGEKEVPAWTLPGIYNSAYDKVSNPSTSDLFDGTDKTRVKFL